jgi:tRNA threonylcarbamoyladenosine biosynthesis protein TsaE
MKLNILSKSKEETQDIALNLAKSLKEGRAIAFNGNLGSGKTTFIQGLAKGLNINEKISSPTFVIFKKYKVSNHKDIKWFYHFDLYRINTLEEIIDLGFEEIINNKNTLIAIEWAEKIKKLLPKDSLNIKIKFINKNYRKIFVS